MKRICPVASRAFAANKAPLPSQKNTLRTRHCDEGSNPGKLTDLDCFTAFAMTARKVFIKQNKYIIKTTNLLISKLTMI
jgi:hypothetical protein